MKNPSEQELVKGRAERSRAGSTSPVHRERLHNSSEGAEVPFGAALSATGVSYRVWSPGRGSLQIEIENGQNERWVLDTHVDDAGYHFVQDPAGRAGDCYRFILDGQQTVPDPVSRRQKDNVFGWSVVVDPKAYKWADHNWQRPPFRDLAIYELHVGTFTQEGTFLAVIEKLTALKELGINAIELMPIADFPGDRNWGYDGVLLYAPARAYGTPDDLRALVDAAHAHGMAVILDVVYNHTGPDGSSLKELATEYFHQTHQTPWGAGFNLDGPDSQPVRDFFTWNPVYWMQEYHIDGVRLDATHWITDESPRHLLSVISDRVHGLGGYVIAEDERNEVRLIESTAQGGFNLDGVWADDFHHSVRVSQTGEKHAYLQNFSGTLEETIDTLKFGWRFRGQLADKDGKNRGSECGHVPPSRLIHCISNHDQVGNQAFGDRLSSGIAAESFRAISMLLCLTPYTPLIFMGQEWSATSPFLFFTDHNPELGKLITEGRRKEFAEFPEFVDEAKIEEIPDPQERSTFLRSKLDWSEAELPANSCILALYSHCLKLRQREKAFRPDDRSIWGVGKVQAGVGYLRYEAPRVIYLLLFHLWPNGELLEMPWDQLPLPQPCAEPELVLSSNAVEFGGVGIRFAAETGSYVFGGAETLLLKIAKPLAAQNS